MSNIHFTSDQHYGHANIIKFSNRPYTSVEEMNEDLIERHNSVVKRGDLCYSLGDLFWRDLTHQQAVSIRSRLNGQHYFINGNHDERMAHDDMAKLFIWRKDIAQIHPAGYPRIVLCHYPFKSWNGSNHGTWSLFGHCHGNLPTDNSLSYDVGVDNNGYYPISLEQVAEKMKAKMELACLNSQQQTSVNL